LDHGGGFRFALFQHHIELGSTEILGRRVAEWIGPKLAQRFAPVLQHLVERLPAGAVAEEAVIVLQLKIVTVDIHRRQARSAVHAKCSRCGDGVGHDLALREPVLNVRAERNVSPGAKPLTGQPKS
jgi:hypothetical protein